jgi:hypothetical protein
LKLVKAERLLVVSKTQQRRNKLTKQLEQQLEIAKADLNGTPHSATTTKRLTDKATGEIKLVEVPKVLKRWWWFGEGNKIILNVKYGSKALALNAKGANAIELQDASELLTVLEQLILAANSGEFDASFEQSAKRK